MGKIEKIEDIQAWQKARELTKQIYKITKDAQFSKGFWIKGSDKTGYGFINGKYCRRVCKTD
ncbi:MAG: hypothetical protein QMC80_01655 [Thermoplasmatales archaeon]|nr:hypothetical protein [Thermoplasmatales archaeon]